jgi:hypothetical protein
MKTLASILVLTALLLFPEAAMAQAKSCSISPDPVATGSTYTVTASGYKPNSEIGFMDYYGSRDTTVTTDADGSATVTFTLPADAATGSRMLMSEVYPIPYKASAASACWASVV